MQSLQKTVSIMKEPKFILRLRTTITSAVARIDPVTILISCVGILIAYYVGIYATGHIHSDNLLQSSPKPRAIALLPLVVFLGIYLIGSIVAGDFYKIPITVAGMIASVVAVMMLRGRTLTERVDSGVFRVLKKQC